LHLQLFSDCCDPVFSTTFNRMCEYLLSGIVVRVAVNELFHLNCLSLTVHVPQIMHRSL